MLLLDYARENGLAMGSITSPGHGSRHAGWTTDEALMEKMRAAGAIVVTGYGVDTHNHGQPAGWDAKSADTPMGWEIIFQQGAEAILEAAAA